jgi:hypothetical protein
MNLSDRTQQFFKPYLPSASADLALPHSLGNLLNELLIAQKSLIDRLVLMLLVTQALSVFNECKSVVWQCIGASVTSGGSKPARFSRCRREWQLPASAHAVPEPAHLSELARG